MINKKKSIIIIFSIIIVLAITIRFYRLGAVPNILNADEASIAYNALLLHETGKDEWGDRWPLVMDAFGDQKIIGYTFLTHLIFFIMPYSDSSVRFASAAAGIILIIISYFFAKRLFFQLEFKDKEKASYFALVFCLILSLLPVFIFYSRTAYEANVSLVFFVGALLILLEQKTTLLKDLLLLSMLFCSVLMYNSSIILIPFLIPTVIFYRSFKKPDRWLRTTLLIGLFCLICYFILLPLVAQKSQITIFSTANWYEYTLYRNRFSGLWQKVFGNQYIFYCQFIIINLFKSLTYAFNVHNGNGHTWHAIPNYGYLTTSIYLGFWLGLTIAAFFSIKIVLSRLFTKKVLRLRDKNLILLVCWPFLSLLPSLITVNCPHATRTLLFFWFAALLCTYFLFVINKKILTSIFVVIFIIEASLYLKQYFGIYQSDPRQQAMFNPGYDKMIMQLDKEYPNETKAVIDGRGFQYILTAWYLKIDPTTFNQTVHKQLPDSIDFKYGDHVGNIHFYKNKSDVKKENWLIYWDSDQSQWQAEKR